MRNPRIHVPFAIASNHHVELPLEASRHIARVLRMRVDDPITLFDGCGGEFAAHITSVNPKRVEAKCSERQNVERESPMPITLAQGMSKGSRMDIVVQKATELGVTQIVPLMTARSVLKLDGDKALARQSHWQGVAVSACEQCGRNRVPEVAIPIALDTWLNDRTRVGAAWILAPDAEQPLLALASEAAGFDHRPSTVLIGPEGGFNDDEIQQALSLGFNAATLGPRILRTETAAIAVLSVLQTVLGDFR